MINKVLRDMYARVNTAGRFLSKFSDIFSRFTTYHSVKELPHSVYIETKWSKLVLFSTDEEIYICLTVTSVPYNFSSCYAHIDVNFPLFCSI